MANKRISELTTITGANLADADLLVVVDVSDTTMASSGTNKKITMAELAKDSALTDNLIAKTTLTTDGDVLTRAAGAPARITRDDLAQDSAFSSRYVAKADEEYRWVSYGEMLGVLGAALSNPANQSEGNSAGWTLDASQLEAVKWSAILPDYWATYKVDVYWLNQANSSGDVRIKMSGKHAGSGDNPDGTGAIIQTVTVAAPTTWLTVAVTSFPSATEITNVAGKPVFLQFIRFGADAADTLANDILVLGALFRRVT